MHFGSYKVRMTMYKGGIEVMDPTVKANLTTVDCLIQSGSVDQGITYAIYSIRL
jgi:hypothetical protein